VLDTSAIEQLVVIDSSILNGYNMFKKMKVLSNSRMVDFRSDTVTRPSLELRESILHCQVGDDVADEDQSTNML
jgi:hypothetical protein